jgi:gas vesicle protein
MFSYGELVAIWDALDMMPDKATLTVEDEVVSIADLKEKVKLKGDHVKQIKEEGPTVELSGYDGRRVIVVGDAAKELIRKLNNPTKEELEERKKVRKRVRELAKTIEDRLVK